MADQEDVYRQVNACFKTSHFENNGWRLCNRLDVSNFRKLEDNKVSMLIDYEHIITHHGLVITQKERLTLPLLYELIWQFRTCNIYDVAINCDQKAVLLKLEKCCKADDCTMYLLIQRGDIAYDKDFDPWVEKMKSQKQDTEIHIELQVLREIPELWQALTVFPQSKVHIEKAKYITLEESKRLYPMKKVHFYGTQESTLSEHTTNSYDLESFGTCDTEISSMNSFTTKLEQHDHLQSLTIKNVITDTVQPIARLQQLSHIHLEGLTRSNISESIFTLQKLECLHIIACQLESLPQNAFDKMQNLKTLDLSSNHLAVLPTSLVNLSILETLNLENNFLKTVDQIVTLTKLEKLNLNSNLISELPKEISGFKNLQSLSLNNNALEKFPKSLEKVKTLQELCLDFNRLSLFPTEVTMLNNMKKLSLKGNSVKDVPSTIGNLEELEVLELTENCISVLPQDIGGCINLKKLNVDDNALDNLPETMREICSLRMMSIERNKLSAFPKVLSEIPSLRILRINGNSIKEIPSCIKEMKSLEILGLNKTDISALSPEIMQCHKLEQLWIDDNDIDRLPESMIDLTNLELLSIERNKLSTFPDAVVKMSSLRAIQLGGNNIKEIPPCIKEMKSLEWLGVNKTGITVIPDELSHCKKLRKLLINDNAIESLPDSMKDLTNLEILAMKRNKLSVFPSIVLKLSLLYLEGNMFKEIPSNIREMKSLEELNMNKTGITVIPDELSHCKKLRTLCINDNAIESLPDSMKDLTNLEILSLKGNKLSVFPSTVLKLSSLKELYLEGNRIKHIPPTIREMKSIEILDLKNTDISALPDDISCCQKLKRLGIENNAIEDLPQSMKNLRKPELIAIQRNNLSAFPNVLTKMPSLKILYMDGNNIKEIPPGIKHMTSLEELKLDKTGLLVLPDDISHCLKLKKLWIEDNEIEVLPESMENLSNLEGLAVNHNKLSCFPACLRKMTALEALLMRGNKIKKIPSWIKDMKSLKTLDVYNNGISVLPEEISHCQKMKGLGLVSNTLEALPETIKDLRYLEELKIQDNKLLAFPKVLLELSALKILYLRGNNIKTIPPDIKEMTSLEEVAFNNTGITAVPGEIGFLTSLKKIWIGDNNITSLPLALKLLTRLQSLYAKGNDIRVIPDVFEGMLQMETLEVDTYCIEYPPPSICRGGVKAIAQFYKDYRGDAVLKNSRKKINLIGETMVGKTSLARCLNLDLQGYMEQETKRTQVLETMLWKPDDNIEFQINDFGGHHLYKITYHIFQTEKSTNLIMYDLPRYNKKVFQQCIGFWLDRLLASYQGMSDVFIIGTRMDEVEQDEDIQRKENDIKDEVNAIRNNLTKRLDAEIQALKKELKSQRINVGKSYTFNEAREHDVRTSSSWRDFQTMELQDLEQPYGGIAFGDEVQGSQQWRQSEKVQAIYSKLNTVTRLQSDLRNVKFHFHVISCKTGQGLKEIHKSLCDIGKSSCQQIPESWQDTIKKIQKYLKETHNASVDIEELFQVTQTQAVHEFAVIDRTSFEWRQFTEILSHLHYCGEILWYKQIKDLEDVVFPNIQRLIDVLKSIFHHDLERHISDVKALYPSVLTFQHDVDSWRRCGKMTEVLLERLLKSKGLAHVPVDVVKQLLAHFNICYVFEAERTINKPSLLMPWFLKEKQPLEVSHKWKQSQGPLQYNVAITFNFVDYIPETFFERLVVLSASTAASHSPDVYIWKDGLYCKVNMVQIILEAIDRRGDDPEEAEIEGGQNEDFPIRECSEIKLHAKGRNILGVWDVVFPLFEKVSMYIQEQWPGITYAAEMACPHCIQNNITPCDVIQQEFFGSMCPGHVEYMQCNETESEIPAVIARPVTTKMSTSGQREVLKFYEAEIQNKMYEKGPLTHKIIVWLADKVGPRYGRLASFLDVPFEREQKIQAEHPRNVDRQIIEILKYFRKVFMDQGKTNEECLQHLMTTLDDCDLKQFRQDLERKLHESPSQKKDLDMNMQLADLK